MSIYSTHLQADQEYQMQEEQLAAQMQLTMNQVRDASKQMRWPQPRDSSFQNTLNPRLCTLRCVLSDPISLTNRLITLDQSDRIYQKAKFLRKYQAPQPCLGIRRLKSHQDNRNSLKLKNRTNTHSRKNSFCSSTMMKCRRRIFRSRVMLKA